MDAHGVMFHHFCDSRHPRGQGAIGGEELDALLCRLGPGRILPAEEWIARAGSDRLRRGDICLTFDDGLLCQYDVALPVLRQHGLTALWFVYSSVFYGNVETLEIYRYFRTVAFDSVEDFYAALFPLVEERWPDAWRAARAGYADFAEFTAYPFYTRNDWLYRYLRDVTLDHERHGEAMAALMAEHGFDAGEVRDRLWMRDVHLRELQADGHLIGLHSNTHPTAIAGLPPEIQESEYRSNMDHLTALLGTPPRTMSHPCNSYSRSTLDILSRLGVLHGFRADMEPVEGRSRYEHPRQDHAVAMKELGLRR